MPTDEEAVSKLSGAEARDLLLEMVVFLRRIDLQLFQIYNKLESIENRLYTSSLPVSGTVSVVNHKDSDLGEEPLTVVVRDRRF